MIRRPPRSTLDRSSAASDVYKRQDDYCADTSEVCLLFPQVSLLGEMEQKNLGRIVKLNNNGYGFAGLDDPINGGMVNVYRINENKKWELTQKISSPSGANTSFGYEISSDNDILLISENEIGSQNGICYLYQLKNGVFTLVTSLTGESVNDRVLFGTKTEISDQVIACLLYTSPSPRDRTRSRMPSSA